MNDHRCWPYSCYNLRKCFTVQTSSTWFISADLSIRGNPHTFVTAVIHSGETQCQNQNRRCWPRQGASSSTAYCWWSHTKCCSWHWQPAVQVCSCSLVRAQQCCCYHIAHVPSAPRTAAQRGTTWLSAADMNFIVKLLVWLALKCNQRIPLSQLK